MEEHSVPLSDFETTDLIICGCGPTGALLAAHLGLRGVRNIVLEKEADITTDPRGIALDEDGIRALQGVGIYDKIYSEIGRSMGVFNFIGGVHHDLQRKPFLRMTYGTTEGGTGHVGFICHNQPVLEANLRLAMKRTEFCDLRVSSTLTSISESNEWVYATYSDGYGVERRLRAKFLVGADGKTGFTRKKYLEPKGVLMEQVSQHHYQEAWVALNWKLSIPTPTTHPDFPLWSLGYTPEEVYDLFFPPDFRFLCNPERPAVCGRFGLPKDRLWRFEFVVKTDEDAFKMAESQIIQEIVHPYITHPGSRYGLKETVKYPEDCIQVMRCRPFWFSARSCNKWALGRVVLAGDSAHVFPPFGGQGIASGFRDAEALAWRLELACGPSFTAHEELLTGWYSERKQQLEHSLAATIENGRYVTDSNFWRVQLRNTQLWLMQLIPSWRRWLEKGQRRNGMVRYDYRPGMAFLPELGGGVCFPQGYCVPIRCGDVAEQIASVMFTDDAIFASHKRGLFQLVVLLEHEDQLDAARSILENLGAHPTELLYEAEATFLVRNTDTTGQTHSDKKVADCVVKSTPQETNAFRLTTANVFGQSHLCRNRPKPINFEVNYLFLVLKDKRFVILRPDRFVFAACVTEQELVRVLNAIPKVLHGGQP